MKAEQILSKLESLLNEKYNLEEILNIFKNYQEIETIEDLIIEIQNNIVSFYSKLEKYGNIFFIELDENNIIDGVYAE